MLRDATDIALAHHGADSFLYASALSAWGSLALRRGEHETAVERQQTAIPVFDRLGRRRRAARARLCLGRALLGMGDLDGADAAIVAALAQAEEIWGAQSHKLANYLLGRAEVDLARGSRGAATATLRRAEALAVSEPGEAEVLEGIRALLR